MRWGFAAYASASASVDAVAVMMMGFKTPPRNALVSEK